MEDDRLPLTRSLEAEVRTAFALPSQTEGLNGERLTEALATLQVAHYFLRILSMFCCAE